MFVCLFRLCVRYVLFFSCLFVFLSIVSVCWVYVGVCCLIVVPLFFVFVSCCCLLLFSWYFIILTFILFIVFVLLLLFVRCCCCLSVVYCLSVFCSLLFAVFFFVVLIVVSLFFLIGSSRCLQLFVSSSCQRLCFHSTRTLCTPTRSRRSVLEMEANNSCGLHAFLAE